MSVLNRGVLRRCPENPRYFQDGEGRAVLLTGSHTWANLQDILVEGGRPFPYDEFLEMLVSHGHNFMRCWQWNHPMWTPWTSQPTRIEPLPWQRTGPGLAQDGKPKFDLTKWNEAYFERIRERIVRAGERGIYTSVMFFDGWTLRNTRFEASDAWATHPFNGANNVNGVHGDPDGDGITDIYSLESPEVLEFQKAFIRKTIDTLNDLDHVLWEIINEVEPSLRAYAWHIHMVDYVHAYEATLPKQHPVGMTAVSGTQDNNLLFYSPADFIAPGNGPNREYRYNPPAADGRKVIITDTDHLWGVGGNYHWVWRSFTRGLNPIFMDPWEPLTGRLDYPAGAENHVNRRDYPEWEPLRRSMGAVRRMSERIDRKRSTPQNNLASSRFCLADPGTSYVVYVPLTQRVVTVDLSAARSTLRYEWSDPVTAEVAGTGTVAGGGLAEFPVPDSLQRDAVLLVQRP